MYLPVVVIKGLTKNHSVEEQYIEAVLSEWNIYAKALGEKPIIRNIHLGGGSPTFFSSENLHKLLFTILETSEIHPQKLSVLKVIPIIRLMNN